MVLFLAAHSFVTCGKISFGEGEVHLFTGTHFNLDSPTHQHSSLRDRGQSESKTLHYSSHISRISYE